jgi:predicted glycoside hydrolase/deacetylase ChbG (UPF0249 family)
MELLVTADDYGLAPQVNEAIERLAAAGTIDAVSVMVHEESHLDHVARLTEAGVATGLHIALTGVHPLSEQVSSSPLVNHDGRLPRNYATLFAKLSAIRHAPDLLRAEVDAQLERFLSSGLPLGFINGHQHVHAYPPIWRAIAGTVSRRSQTVRLALGQRAGPSKQGLLNACSRMCWSLSELAGHTILSPVGVDGSCRLNLEAMTRAARVRLKAPNGVHRLVKELVVHPATRSVVDENLREDRLGEFEALSSSGFAELRRRHPRPSSFHAGAFT